MRKFFRWIVSVLGYGAYTLVLLVALLWFLFPTESLRVWLEAKLAQQDDGLSWKIGELRRAWPLSLVGVNIKAVTKGEGAPLVTIDAVKVKPDILRIVSPEARWPVSYSASILGGTISGDASLNREQETVQCSGVITGVMIEGLEGVWQQLGRQAGGRLSGSFNFEGKPEGLLSGNMQAKLSLEDGSLQLLQPVLGMDTLQFNRLTTSLSLKDRIATLEKGKVDSDRFGADFAGTLTLNNSLFSSGLDIKGSFEPRPELLGSLKDAAVLQLMKSQLKEGRLNFTLSDTLLQPGIAFLGVSGVIDGIIQGGGR